MRWFPRRLRGARDPEDIVAGGIGAGAGVGRSRYSNTGSPLLPHKRKWRNGSGRGRRRNEVTCLGRGGRSGACAGHAGSSVVSLAAAGEGGQTTGRRESLKPLPRPIDPGSAPVRASFSVRGNMG